MELTKWDKRFYNLAKEVATWSKDPNKQVGAVVISTDKRRVSYGYNGFPAGVRDDNRLEDRSVKNSLCLHAEVNAILNAKTDVRGWSLYCSESICTNCALVVIQSGVAKVVMPHISQDSNWYQCCQNAISLFKEANVTVNLI